jgi:beta-galactosidase
MTETQSPQVEISRAEISRAQSSKILSPRAREYSGKDFLYGVCYFPEQWPETIWDDDLRRMAAMGMNTIRMGEGAWHLWEPEEGRYDFALFDRAIELATKHGLKVILGTPTYAPPAWLTERYPEVLRVSFNGTPMHHGSRRHYNYTSKKYLELCSGVVTALAEHYGQDERVIGWQIDNEFNCHMDVSFAESDDVAFRAWCHNRYGTLESLNTAWGTSFWSQHYNDWSQVHLPRPTSAYHNPGHLLDFYRFTSSATVEFSKLQYEILLSLTPNQFVTHNGFFGNVDNHDLTERGMDFMSFDSYPAFYFFRDDLPAHFKDRSTGHRLSTVRGLSSKFLVLEQQSGPGGQSGGAAFAGARDYLHPTPRPGQMRLWAWHSIAHGADGVLFFRWRTARFGSETLWHGLNHYGNQPSRRYAEAEQLGRELSQLAPKLLESLPEATAAILYDYDNDSNVHIEGYIGSAFLALDESLYRTLSERHILADRVPFNSLTDPAQLEHYKVVFYPNAQLLESKDLPVLRAYVEQGGTLVFGPRSGYKDRLNQCHDLPLPGVIRELADLEIEDFTMLEHAPTVRVSFGSTASTEALVFAEIIKSNNGQATVLATYSGGDDDGAPAIIRVPLGRGSIVYCGTFLPAEGLHTLLEALQVHAPSDGLLEVPKEIEVISRNMPGATLHMLLNFSDQPQTVRVHEPCLNALDGETTSGTAAIAPFDVLLLERSRK